ncbi:MAG: class I SAM-dependent methyltransferase [Hyphomicrobium sp.]
MQPPHAIVEAPPEMTPPISSWRDGAIARTLQKAFGPQTRGRLEVVLPSAHRVMLGSGNEAPARLVLHSYAVLWRLATRGSLGPAESYLRGEIDTPDLGAVLRFFIANYALLEGAGSGAFTFKPRLPDILWHRRRENTLKGSRRNIAAHYDLGNAFYRLWLDPGMTYSSAVYRDAATALEAAQDEKYNVVLDALGELKSKSLLEIGCGWGGLAERAIQRGADSIVGLTLSTEQLAYARDRLKRAGVSARADLRLQDYRATDGAFDAIASVEMIEAVGEAHWPHYFKTLHERLKPGGVAAIQAITIDERYFESYRKQADFIQRYIFPGGMLPTITRMRDEAQSAGLSFEIVERFGQSYARTLREWRSAFRAAWPEIEKQGFDERFRRMWEYYLTYCEVGFESGDVDVGVYRMTRAAG